MGESYILYRISSQYSSIYGDGDIFCRKIPLGFTLQTESPSIFLDKSGRGKNLCQHPQQFLQIQIFLRCQSNYYRSIHCVCQQM